jgi:hypothetical protein
MEVTPYRLGLLNSKEQPLQKKIVFIGSGTFQDKSHGGARACVTLYGCK